jgi:LacI family transcriptional regulator
MPTIRDVATSAGVSTTTVSHVINGTRFVEPETAERVYTAIKKLGYRPNSLARSLRRGETGIVGLIVPDSSNPFFADIARKVEDTGFAKGYNVILCNSDLSLEKEEAYLNSLLSKQVDGLILIPSSDYSSQLQTVIEAGVPVVVLDRELDSALVDQVLVDNEQGGYQVGRYLLQLGHKRLGCISGPQNIRPVLERVQGFQRALSEAGVKAKLAESLEGNLRTLDGEIAMQNLLEQDFDLSAVFAVNDLMALGAVNVLRRANHRIPEDISIVGFDNILPAVTLSPALTSVAQPTKRMAEISVSLLLERMKNPLKAPDRVVLTTTLIERESSGPPTHK